MATYPSNLPAPLIAEYSNSVNFGLSAIQFETGHRRQRRGAKRERQVFGLALVMPRALQYQWQTWINQYGYDFHYLDLESNWSGGTGQTLIPHFVRVIGDIVVEEIDGMNVKITYQVEMDLNTLPTGAFVPSGNWYVARTPSTPPTDRIIAGTPSSPSTDWVIAGTPGIPAA